MVASVKHAYQSATADDPTHEVSSSEWNADHNLTGTIDVANGGTGIITYTVGDLLYASAANVLSKLSDIATGNALISGGAGVAPSWNKIGLTTHITGTLAETNGGTGQAVYTVGQILYANTTTTLAKLTIAAAGNVLISGATPAWGKVDLTAHVTGTLPVGNGGTGITASYAVGDLLYASAAGSLTRLADVATGNALISGGVTTAPLWGKIGLTTHVSGTLPIANGGTGTTTGISAADQAALDLKANLAGATFTGDCFISKTNPAFVLDGSSANGSIYGRKGGLERWVVRVADSTAETGTPPNSGTNFVVSRYTDAGAYIDNPFVISRADARATFSGGITAVTSAYTYIGANLQVHPLSSAGVAISWNFTNGAGETDFWNCYTAGGPLAFSFKQLTGASSHTDLLNIDTVGNVSAAGSVGAPSFTTTNGYYFVGTAGYLAYNSAGNSFLFSGTAGLEINGTLFSNSTISAAGSITGGNLISTTNIQAQSGIYYFNDGNKYLRWNTSTGAYQLMGGGIQINGGLVVDNYIVAAGGTYYFTGDYTKYLTWNGTVFKFNSGLQLDSNLSVVGGVIYFQDSAKYMQYFTPSALFFFSAPIQTNNYLCFLDTGKNFYYDTDYSSFVLNGGGLIVNGMFLANSVRATMGVVYSDMSAAGQNVYFAARDQNGANKALFFYEPGSDRVKISNQSGGDPFAVRNNGVIELGDGFTGRSGMYGVYDGNAHNIYWTGAVNDLYVDNVLMGAISVTCDYRIKKDVADLPSTWDKVKALRPISYTPAEYTPPPEIEHHNRLVEEGKKEAVEISPMFIDSDVEHWGFIAHELQDTLLPTAANGYKDVPNEVQSPNWLPIIAALTKTLQEAQLRIEALEATVAQLQAR